MAVSPSSSLLPHIASPGEESNPIERLPSSAAGNGDEVDGADGGDDRKEDCYLPPIPDWVRNFPELAAAQQRYRPQQMIGKGAYGLVWYVRVISVRKRSATSQCNTY